MKSTLKISPLLASFFLLTLHFILWFFNPDNPPPDLPDHIENRDIDKDVSSSKAEGVNVKKIVAGLSIRGSIKKELEDLLGVLSKERAEKLIKELEGINKKTSDKNTCEQYALRSSKTGLYPCLKCEEGELVHLEIDEVWKYGKTCLGEEKRYYDLVAQGLYYDPEFVGSEIECLVQEKIKIYGYYLLPENQKRGQALSRPPGNKIDR